MRSADKRCEINRGNDPLVTALTLACLAKMRCLLFCMFSVYRRLSRFMLLFGFEQALFPGNRLMFGLPLLRRLSSTVRKFADRLQ